MPVDDLPSAARRVADETRRNAGAAPTVFLSAMDAAALLPVLDAVAAGQGDAGRVERWARAMCRAEGMDPDGCLEGSPDWMYCEPQARAAIALADAERVAGVSERA